MITETLYQELKKITEEEQYYLDGKKDIQKTLYMSQNSNMIDAAKLLEKGKLIQVRPHTRFMHFPRHTHNYMPFILMDFLNYSLIILIAKQLVLTFHLVNCKHLPLHMLLQ